MSTSNEARRNKSLAGTFCRDSVQIVTCFVAFLGAATIAAVRADDLTGIGPDDSKEILTVNTTPSNHASGFVPLPSWAHLIAMPPLPDALKPMGKKTAVASTSTTEKPPLAPPKDATSAAPLEAVTKPAPATPPQTPAQIAVSPFLQWIKADPQGAATQARQQAELYDSGGLSTQGAGAPVPPRGGVHHPGTSSGSTGPMVPGSDAAGEGYWLPPMIDASPINNAPPIGSSSTDGSSAAIYSTPQR